MGSVSAVRGLVGVSVGEAVSRLVPFEKITTADDDGRRVRHTETDGLTVEFRPEPENEIPDKSGLRPQQERRPRREPAPLFDTGRMDFGETRPRARKVNARGELVSYQDELPLICEKCGGERSELVAVVRRGRGRPSKRVHVLLYSLLCRSCVGGQVRPKAAKQAKQAEQVAA